MRLGRIAARASRNDEPCCWLIFGQVGVSGSLRSFPQPGFGWREMSEAGARVCRGAQDWSRVSTARRSARTISESALTLKFHGHGFDER